MLSIYHVKGSILEYTLFKNQLVMAGIMCQLLPEHYQHYSKTSIFISISSDSFGKFLVTAEYSVATHNNTFCPLSNCKYHILLRSTNFEKLLKELESYHFVYQLVDCFYTLYKYQFFKNVIIETGGVFDIVAKAVTHNTQNKSVEKTPSIAKKRLTRKKFKKHCSAGQKSASTQTLGSSFLDRIQKIRNSKYESDLMKIVDCFLDGYGSIDNNFVTFKLKK